MDNHDPCPVIQARDLAALGEAEVKLRLLFRSAAVTPHDPRHSLGSFLRLLRHYMPHAPAIKPGARTKSRCRYPRTSGEQWRSEEHTSELQSLMRISYAVFCLKKKK